MIHRDHRKYGRNNRSLIVGTTNTVNGVPQNVVYGVAVQIVDGRLVVDEATKQEIASKVEEWSESTGREYVMPDFYSIITGDLEWSDTAEYYL